MKERFSNWVNSPITWKSYGKMCIVIYIFYLCIITGMVCSMYSEQIIGWFKSKFRRHKTTEFAYNEEES